jgi:type II secretion system protein C
MDTILKRHFWVANLITLALLAWIVSSGVNDVVRSALFSVPAAAGSAAKKVRDQNGRDDGTRGARIDQDLIAWSIFNRDKKPVVAKSESDDGNKGDKPPVEPQGDEELPESELANVQLVGTMFTRDNPARSVATMSVDQANRLAWIGTEFLDGKVKMVRIEPRHVVVNEEGTLKVIKLWTDKNVAASGGRSRGRFNKNARSTTSKRPTRSSARPAVRTSSLLKNRTEMRKHIKKSGPYSYSIDRSYLKKNMDDMGKLGKQARIVPNYRGGKTQGYKMVGVRPGSLFRALGIRSGDVIKAVNGNAIDSPSKALGLFEQLKSSSSLTLEIERRGQPKEISYSIQ